MRVSDVTIYENSAPTGKYNTYMVVLPMAVKEDWVAGNIYYRTYSLLDNEHIRRMA